MPDERPTVQLIATHEEVVEMRERMADLKDRFDSHLATMQESLDKRATAEDLALVRAQVATLQVMLGELLASLARL